MRTKITANTDTFYKVLVFKFNLELIGILDNFHLSFFTFLLLVCHSTDPEVHSVLHTAQKMKFTSKDFFSNCDQIRSSCVVGHIY